MQEQEKSSKTFPSPDAVGSENFSPDVKNEASPPKAAGLGEDASVDLVLGKQSVSQSAADYGDGEPDD